MYEIYAKLRDERGMTDYQVCKATNISTATMRCWKSGKYTPKIDRMVKIAKLFGVTLDELVGVEPHK